MDHVAPPEMARRLDYRPASLPPQYVQSEHLHQNLHHISQTAAAAPHIINMAPRQSPVRARPTLPKPAPHRLSIEMIHETVRQIESCMSAELKSSLTRIRLNVEPPASRLDRLVKQFEHQQRVTGRSTGLSFLEKQIEAADDQVAVALLTEVRLTLSTCEPKLAAYDRVPMVFSEDAQRLKMLYDWLCHKWKFGKEQVRSMAQAVSPSDVSAIQSSAVAVAPLQKLGKK